MAEDDEVFLVLTFLDGVTKTVGDLPVERLRARAREWTQLHPGTVAELRRGPATIEVLTNESKGPVSAPQ